jgi:hypothetical protein
MGMAVMCAILVSELAVNYSTSSAVHPFAFRIAHWCCAYALSLVYSVLELAQDERQPLEIVGLPANQVPAVHCARIVD